MRFLRLPRTPAWAVGGLILASWAVSCAKGANVDPAPAGAAGFDGGMETSVFPTLTLGSPCKTGSDCESGQCSYVGQGRRVCTERCVQGTPCPEGSYCAFDPNAGYVCVLSNHNQCAECENDSNCPNPGDHCAVTPKYLDHFCARDCSFDGVCPAGFTCVPTDGYGPTTGDAGAAPSPGDAGPSARMCVPVDNQSCPCNAQRNGVQRTCTQTSASMTCGGTETCNGGTGQWEGCTAGTPQPESCDGADDDCDGRVDNGTDQELCQRATGLTAPPHGQWKCDSAAGACVVGACDPGYAKYPLSLPATQGCPCKVDAAEPNDTCGQATDAGSVSDANASSLNLIGTLSSDTDVDWYKFNTVDSDEGTTNSYHVKIKFTLPADASEFVFDVIRGNQCGTPDAKHSNLSSYDWCVDGTGTDASGATIGEQKCGPNGPIHCGPHTKMYYVAVHRKVGAAGTCTQYQLTVTAKGTGSCDFSQTTGACDPQVNDTSP